MPPQLLGGERDRLGRLPTVCNVEYSKHGTVDDQNVRWRQARWQPNGAELGTRAILMASFLDSRIHTSAVRTEIQYVLSIYVWKQSIELKIR